MGGGSGNDLFLFGVNLRMYNIVHALRKCENYSYSATSVASIDFKIESDIIINFVPWLTHTSRGGKKPGLWVVGVASE